MMAPFQEKLIVDGYNIAHAWAELERLLLDSGELAVEQLMSALREIHDGRQVAVAIVLDGKGETTEITRPYRDDSFVQIYSARSLTADAVIEQMVAKAARPERIYVASGDRAILRAIEACGAAGLSPEALRDWLEGARRAARIRVERRNEIDDSDWGNRIPL